MLPGLCMPAGLLASGVSYFQSHATGGANVSASLAINKPTGTVSGDILVALMGAQSGPTWTGDTGWTERVDHGADPSLRLATLGAGGSEPSSYTFTSSFLTVSSGLIACFRGLQYDTIGGAVSTLTGDGTLTISGITAAGGILIAAVISNDASGSIAHSTPSGFVKIATVISPVNAYVGASLFYKEVAAGSTGSVATDITGTTGENAGILIALKP